jgi:SnoaL-like protein
MTEDMLRSWLDAYGRAWEARDPEAVIALFAEDGTYQETPFVEPMCGRPAIAAYWSRATGPHTNVHFEYEVLALDSNQGIARWCCSFVRVPVKASLKLYGIFVLQFDREGRCQSLREWWHRQENQAR